MKKTIYKTLALKGLSGSCSFQILTYLPTYSFHKPAVVMQSWISLTQATLSIRKFNSRRIHSKHKFDKLLLSKESFKTFTGHNQTWSAIIIQVIKYSHSNTLSPLRPIIFNHFHVVPQSSAATKTSNCILKYTQKDFISQILRRTVQYTNLNVYGYGFCNSLHLRKFCHSRLHHRCRAFRRCEFVCELYVYWRS